MTTESGPHRGLGAEFIPAFNLVRARLALAILRSRAASLRNRIAALQAGQDSEAARDILTRSCAELDARIEAVQQHSSTATEGLGRCLVELDAQATTLDSRAEDLRKLRAAKATNPVAFLAMMLLNRIQHFAIKARGEILRGIMRPVSETVQRVRAAGAGATQESIAFSQERLPPMLRNPFVRTNLLIGVAMLPVGAWAYTKLPTIDSLPVVLALSSLVFIVGLFLPITLGIIGGIRARRAGTSLLVLVLSVFLPCTMHFTGTLLTRPFLEKANVAAERGLMLLDRPQVAGATAYLTMPNGAEVEVLEKRPQWYRVRYEGKVGWTSAGFLQSEPEQGRMVASNRVARDTQFPPGVEVFLECDDLRRAPRLTVRNTLPTTQRVKINAEAVCDRRHPSTGAWIVGLKAVGDRQVEVAPVSTESEDLRFYCLPKQEFFFGLGFIPCSCQQIRDCRVAQVRTLN